MATGLERWALHLDLCRSWPGRHREPRGLELQRGVQLHLHVLGGLLHELPLVPVVGEDNS